MDTSLFFGGSVVAAVVAGSVSLFAPCCISVMLPAYFATAFQNRRLLVAMTFLFAAGVATIVLPIALGAAVLRDLLLSEHTAIYVGMGLVLLALAGYTLLGGRLRIPMPGGRAGGRAGPLSAYSLGIFSGVASSCCAPVLAGVVALSGVAGSFGASLGLGAAYVFGMVAPLFAISLLWERVDWRSSRLFRPRTFSYRLGPLRRTISGSALASGLLLAAMGGAVLWIGLTSDAMPSPEGWVARVSAELRHYGDTVTDALAWVPSWAGAIALVAVVALLARHALRQLERGSGSGGEGETPVPAGGPEVGELERAAEEALEREYA
ncbi:MAG: cytochrome c biogenesis CcdA family protein [Solirubrobacterales bacterium]